VNRQRPHIPAEGPLGPAGVFVAFLRDDRPVLAVAGLCGIGGGFTPRNDVSRRCAVHRKNNSGASFAVRFLWVATGNGLVAGTRPPTNLPALRTMRGAGLTKGKCSHA